LAGTDFQWISNSPQRRFALEGGDCIGDIQKLKQVLTVIKINCEYK